MLWYAVHAKDRFPSERGLIVSTNQDEVRARGLDA